MHNLPLIHIDLSRVMDLNKQIKWKPLIIAIAVPLAVGGAAAFLSMDGFILFGALYKPLFTPPKWVFPVAWTALYILMGIASYLVYTDSASAPRRGRALKVYAVQLAANFLWPILFFAWGLYWAAFLWIIVLWLLILLNLTLFKYISVPAGNLLLPYLLWTAFAAYLNLGVALLN